MRREDVVVYSVKMKKEETITSRVFLASSFALLADDLSGWEKENYTVLSIEYLGSPTVLAPVRVLTTPSNDYN